MSNVSMQESPDARVRRGFIEIAEGQVHYREAGWQHTAKPPLVMFHASPASALTLEPLLRLLGRERHVIAPDTLGNGDSAAPADDQVDLPYLADAHMRALDALGVASCDLYGTHTGANIAIEIAIARPGQVGAVILDGVSLYGAAEQADLLANYMPKVSIDAQGSQFSLLWNFVRDAYLFWPWYKQDAAHRRKGGLPDAQALHDKTVEVLKGARTFHLAYRAAMRYRKEERIPLLKVPTLIACARGDMLFEYFDRVRALLPTAQFAETEGVGSAESASATARQFQAFLESVWRA